MCSLLVSFPFDEFVDEGEGEVGVALLEFCPCSGFDADGVGDECREYVVLLARPRDLFAVVDDSA